MANILNVSQNSNIINEKNALLLFMGKECSIKEHYLSARKNINGGIANKEDFSYIELKGERYPTTDAGSYYELLWYQYLRQNSSIVEEIRKYDDFVDDYGDNEDEIMNSTSRIFRIVRKYGINGLKSNCKEFAAKLNKSRENKKIDPESFEGLDIQAKKLVKQYYGIKDKMEIIKTITNPTLAKLFHIRYEEKDENYSAALVESEIKKMRREYYSE